MHRRIRYFWWRLSSSVRRHWLVLVDVGLLPRVNLYEVWQNYGGPEEGGWWYECGRPVESQRSVWPVCFWQQRRLYRQVKAAPKAPGRYLWIGDDEPYAYEEGAFMVIIERGRGEPFPDEHPRYC